MRARCCVRGTSFFVMLVVICRRLRNGAFSLFHTPLPVPSPSLPLTPHSATSNHADTHTNRMKIKKLPNILALHLKRFKYQEDLGKYIKLAYRVAFPLELRLFNTADGTSNPDRLYELFAIVVHIGRCVVRVRSFRRLGGIVLVVELLRVIPPLILSPSTLSFVPSPSHRLSCSSFVSHLTHLILHVLLHSPSPGRALHISPQSSMLTPPIPLVSPLGL